MCWVERLPAEPDSQIPVSGAVTAPSAAAGPWRENRVTPRVTFQSGERHRGSLTLGSLLGHLEIGSQDCLRFLSCLGGSGRLLGWLIWRLPACRFVHLSEREMQRLAQLTSAPTLLWPRLYPWVSRAGEKNPWYFKLYDSLCLSVSLCFALPLANRCFESGTLGGVRQ